MAFVLCWFVWRSCAAADRAAAHRGKQNAADCGRWIAHNRTWERALRDRRQTLHGHTTGLLRTVHGLLTDGRWAGISQTWTNPAIPRWAAAAQRTCHGRETDTPRAYHGRFPYGQATGGTRACLRASDGRATGGLRSDLDKPRRAKMGGGRLRGTRTGNGLAAR